jgi:hypothetical protein
MAAQPGTAVPPGEPLPIPPDLPLYGREIRALTAGYTGLGDTVAVPGVAGLPGSYRKAFQIRASSENPFADLPRTNVVLAGGSANRWTMHFSEQLRTRSVWDGRSHSASARDRGQPGRAWSVVCGDDKVAREGYAIWQQRGGRTRGRRANPQLRAVEGSKRMETPSSGVPAEESYRGYGFGSSRDN